MLFIRLVGQQAASGSQQVAGCGQQNNATQPSKQTEWTKLTSSFI